MSNIYNDRDKSSRTLYASLDDVDRLGSPEQRPHIDVLRQNLLQLPQSTVAESRLFDELAETRSDGFRMCGSALDGIVDRTGASQTGFKGVGLEFDKDRG